MSQVLVYTVHKAGSSFLDQLMSQTARRYGIAHFSENQDENFDRIHQDSWSQFIGQNESAACFGPIRGSSEKPIFPDGLEKYSILLHLRDPRDVLTSMYFSFVYSHRIRTNRTSVIRDRRKAWQENGIDEFVLKMSIGLRTVFDDLCQRLLPLPNVSLIHYEDMVLNYPFWLNQYLSAFRIIKVPTRKKRHLLLPQGLRKHKIRRQLQKRHQDSFCVQEENIYNHKRKVLPGDHREKLLPETIEHLDSMFEDFLSLRSKSSGKSERRLA